ncbi:hypothetical protein TSAR_006422 [Trichomalopsis sarcophagae]|uniref:Spliceosome-associated protein CWC27 homolog n=1 Tax=Trichomalopsis sarcophagae TaxID=543379 RepID=A0A232FC31_9HYME|nr:hypothetical protein TSAR_006422 [Trichomalopsis sarcophagae]
MSNIYIQEPPTSGKVVMKTSIGDIDLELWTKEAPKACRNFIQLCMEGYYDNTIFHRVVKGFIVQGGDPTGTGEGGESIYGAPFKDEFHTRLRFCRRGLLAMANAGKDDNGSQFFFTLAATPELQNKHTIFGKVGGETIYNMIKLEDALVDENDRPVYPVKVLKTEVLNNPFTDIVPRTVPKKLTDEEKVKKKDKKGVKDFKLLSFGEEAEEDEEESVVISKKLGTKSKSAHDILSDPKLSSQPVIEEDPSKKSESDSENDDDDPRTAEERAAAQKEKQEMTERIKSKLKASTAKIANDPKVSDKEDESSEEEYYLGKERKEELKKLTQAKKKEIRDFKRGMKNEENKKLEKEKQKAEEIKKKEVKSELVLEHNVTKKKYKEEFSKLPRKGAPREDFTSQKMKQFMSKINQIKNVDPGEEESVSSQVVKAKDDDDDDLTDDSWMKTALHSEDSAPVLAKDASTKGDDWFEIYDPRNPLNKRRRGETTDKRALGVLLYYSLRRHARHLHANTVSYYCRELVEQRVECESQQFCARAPKVRVAVTCCSLPEFDTWTWSFVNQRDELFGCTHKEYPHYRGDNNMKEEDCESGVAAMSKMPLRLDSFIDEGLRPRDWQPRPTQCKVPLRLVRLCFLGVLLPAMFVAGPIYLRYRVFSEQLYPLAISDQRLIDGRISTTWCQRQVVKANATFNAYLMNGVPKIQGKATPVTMTRHLVLEDDMKEYWGFYLLRGSSVTVSTCVRWPGASLTMIRGHKHLHECAFIGDDSSEELEELVEVAQERGLLQRPNETNPNSPSNEPSRMKRVHQGVQLHNTNETSYQHHLQHNQQLTSHELDAKDMRAILTQIFMKQLDMKKRQKDANEPSQHHHYEGVFRESDNIVKPPTFDDTEFIKHELLSLRAQASEASVTLEDMGVTSSATVSTTTESTTKTPEVKTTTAESLIAEMSSTLGPSSMEVFEDALHKISALGTRGKKVLNKLIQEINHRDPETEQMVKKVINEVTEKEERRRKRDLLLSSPMGAQLSEDDEDGDAAIEEGMLHPDGIAEDRGTVNETTLNDRSNSEFWSSFSSSEERLLECKGLILNLPLTPHRYCEAKWEHRHSSASIANAVTYRVPTDGYYFFVFSSENEIQPNYLRVKFELLKTMYNTSDPVFQCKNSTGECSLPISFFSSERTVLELPVNGNNSQWNDEYVVISTCEPRTAVYLVCTMAVPLLILMFAFY